MNHRTDQNLNTELSIADEDRLVSALYELSRAAHAYSDRSPSGNLARAVEEADNLLRELVGYSPVDMGS